MKAFSGQLVPQDPTDEPAGRLLNQIKVERERQVDEISKKRKKGKKVMKSKGIPKTKRDVILVLKEAKRPMRPEELFQIAGYKPEEVDQFYADLKTVDQKNAISQEKMECGDVYLKVRE